MVDLDLLKENPEEVRILIVEEPEKAEVLAQIVEDVKVFSQDNKFNSKFHAHHSETGEIMTQINKGSLDWDRILDLRENK